MSGSKRVIQQYWGSLTPEQICTGMNASIENAARLLRDAELVLERGSAPTAAALAILSIEESGKIAILRKLATAKDPKEAKQSWKEFRSHRSKNYLWIFSDILQKGGKKLDDFHQVFDPHSSHPALLDAVKQVSFYTDCYGKAHWSRPSESISLDLARSVLFIAKCLLSPRKVEVSEVNAWIKWMGNQDGMTDTDIRVALAGFYADLQRLGVEQSGDNDMAKFVGLRDGSAF